LIVANEVYASNKCQNGKVGSMKLKILAKKGAKLSLLREQIKKLVVAEPLSRFGIDVDIEVFSHACWNVKSLENNLDRKSWHAYRKGNFYQYDERISKNRLLTVLQDEFDDNEIKIPSIFSKLRLEVPEPIED
jgi:hypothetical protein